MGITKRPDKTEGERRRQQGEAGNKKRERTPFVSMRIIYVRVQGGTSKPLSLNNASSTMFRPLASSLSLVTVSSASSSSF